MIPPVNPVRTRRDGGLNLNSALLAIVIALTGWMGKETYSEIRNTHDLVLTMVPRAEFLVSITELRTRLTSLEIDFTKYKEDHEGSNAARK